MSESSEEELARIRQALRAWRRMEREALKAGSPTGRNERVNSIYIRANIETISEILGED